MYKISVEPAEIEKLPLGNFKGEIKVIDKRGLDSLRAIVYLRSRKMIDFDTETRPVFSPDQPHRHTALLQLSGPGKAFLFRLNRMGLPKLLADILSNEKIIKVGAASGDDMRGLCHYRQVRGRGFVDLQKIAWQWGIRDKSVKKLAANILGVKISKTQQLSNWEARTLSKAQQMYAATDAWVCLEMYTKLLESEKHPLTDEERIPPQQLEQMREAQAHAEEKRMREREKKKAYRKRRKAKKKQNAQVDIEKGTR